MLEKKLEISRLNDFYGGLLTDHQRELVRLYYDCDISLFELSEQFSVSRQAVRDAIQRGEKLLLRFEETLGLMKKSENIASFAAKGIAAPALDKNKLFTAILDELSEESQG